MKISKSKFDFERQKAEFHVKSEIDDVDNFDLAFQIREPGPHKVAWLADVEGPEMGMAAQPREMAIEMCKKKIEQFNYIVKSDNPNNV